MITRPGLSEMQEGAIIVAQAFGIGFVCGTVVGIVLAIIGGIGLALAYGMK